MRSIPESLKAKMMELAQTRANDADPRLEAIISRHVIPITDYDFWQTAQVADFTASRVSVAVYRPEYRRMPQRIYVAGIDDGTANIYSAPFDGINAPQSWSLEMTIANVADISLAFAGRFRPYRRRTEFWTTDEKPWIFWIDTSGDLHAQYWDDETTTEDLGANATSCSATMGVNAVQNTWGQGLLVAWTTEAGAVFYAQYFDGVWSDGIAVTQAPEDAVEVTISRPADWRLIFLVKDDTGAVTALYFRSIAHSMSNWEQVELFGAAITDATITAVNYQEGYADEQVEASAITPAPRTCRITAPLPVRAYNVDDGAGNFGRFILVQFDTQVYDFEDQAASFTITGGFNCLGTTRRIGDGHDLLCLEFEDFNNAVGDLTITYTPGTFGSGYDETTEAAAFNITFTPTGLQPSEIPAPEVVSIANAEGVDPNA